MSATTNIIPPNEDEAEAAAIPAERKEAKAADNKIKYPFWFGGSAASMAACVTHPLDLSMFTPSEQNDCFHILIAFHSQGMNGLPSGVRSQQC